MIPHGNFDLYKGMKGAGNHRYVGKKSFVFYF